jgi:serine/threonine-protein kinase
MQLVEGVSLNVLIKAARAQQRAVPLPLVRLIASGMCEGLAHAHELKDGGRALGVVHRDVTPSNIMVSVAGAVLLTDFGIARVHDSGGGGLRGKSGYLPPELLVAGATVDARADQWSAAMTLYELLTFGNPLRQPTLEASLEALRTVTLPRVETVRPDVTPRMATALMKALSLSANARFPDVRAFGEALLDGPIATAPELGRFVREICGANPLNESHDEGPGTRSVVVTRTMMGEASGSVAPGAPSRAPWVVLGALTAVATAVVAGVAFYDTREPEPLVRSAPVPVATEPPPPGPAPVPAPTPAPAPVVVEPEAVSKAEPPKSRKVARVVKAERPPAGVQVGFLSADAEPWAEVSVDGRVIDRTPFARFPLPVGAHELVFRGPDGREQKRTVTVVVGKTEAVRVEFAP